MRVPTVLAAVLVGLVLGVRAAGAPSLPTGQLIYAAGAGLRLVNVDGSGDRLFRDRAFSPAWSPDGARVMVLDGPDIAIVSSDGVVQSLLAPPSFALPYGFSWSPDGSRVALSGSPDATGSESHIYVMNADGSGARQLTDDPGFDQHPSWSPDGRMIVFTRWADQRFTLYVVGSDGSDLHPLFAHPEHRYDYDPEWSPDGRRIAFTDGDIYPVRIGVVDVDGTHEQVLTTGPDDRAPTWSPDGRYIAFTANTNSAIDTVRSDGSDRREVIGGMHVEAPHWRPVAAALRLAMHSLDPVLIARAPFTLLGGVTSTGAAPAASVSVTVTIQGAARIVALGSGKGACRSRNSPTSVTCDLGDLAAAAFAPLRVQVDPLARGKLVLDVSVTSESDELDRSDNAVSLSTFVSRCSVLGTGAADALRGRKGPDVICGLGGNDVIYARDGSRDLVIGGPGNDTAYVDQFDQVESVEHVHRLPVHRTALSKTAGSRCSRPPPHCDRNSENVTCLCQMCDEKPTIRETIRQVAALHWDRCRRSSRCRTTSRPSSQRWAAASSTRSATGSTAPSCCGGTG